MRDMRSCLGVLLAVAAAGCVEHGPLTIEPGAAAGAVQAHAAPVGFPAGVLVRFNGAASELPEGITVDPQGNVYVGLRALGQIRKLGAGHPGEPITQSLFATIDAGLLGLAADRHGALYAAVPSFRPATHGVWMVTSDGAATRLPGTERIFFPNGLTLDGPGNLYVTSSSGAPLPGGGFADGEIWRVPPGGSAELWLRDPLFTGTNALAPPFPIGVNGIDHRDGNLVVVNTERGRVVRVPIGLDGSPGTPAVIREGLAFPDGVALDPRGDIHVLVTGTSKLVRVTGDGATATDVAGPAEGVDFATSLAFGTRWGDQWSLYLANSAAFPSPMPGRPGPSVLKVSVDPAVPSF